MNISFLFSLFFLSLRLFSADKVIEKFSVYFEPRFCSGDLLSEAYKIELLDVSLKEIMYKISYKKESQDLTLCFCTNRLITSFNLKDQNNCLVLMHSISKPDYIFSLNPKVVFENHSSISNISDTICQPNLSSFRAMPIDSFTINIPIGRVCSPILLKGFTNDCFIYEALFKTVDNTQNQKICTIKIKFFAPKVV